MRKSIYIIAILAMLSSCKDQPSKTQTAPESESEVDVVQKGDTTKPEALVKVLEAHGGLETWEDMETLEFSVEKDEGYEITTTDLKDRFALIEMPEHTLGFDGDTIWLKNKNDRSFRESPEAYYNYMFQLYAMPFVAADEGSTYEKIDDLNYKDKTYSGIHVYFNNHGTTTPDGAAMYYDPETYRMVWLSYQNDIQDQTPQQHFIKYEKWQEVEGLMLPETMVWYAADNDKPGTRENEINFVSPMLTTVKMDMRVFAKPEDADLVQ